MRARVRRIGNSLGVVIPSEEAVRGGLAEGDTVELEIKRRTNLKELFGTASFSSTAQEIKDEARSGWKD